jgi:hypothetical protein
MQRLRKQTRVGRQRHLAADLRVYRWALRGSNPRPSPCKGKANVQFGGSTRSTPEYPSVPLSTSALLREVLRKHRRSAGHAVQVPAIRDSLELMLSGVLEEEARPGNQILDRLGDEHLRRPPPAPRHETRS